MRRALNLAEAAYRGVIQHDIHSTKRSLRLNESIQDVFQDRHVELDDKELGWRVLGLEVIESRRVSGCRNDFLASR